jgi:hypothetical protein
VASDTEDVARIALAEIAPAGTVGDLLERTATDDGVQSLSFVSTLSGYPGWHWSVSIAELPGEEPTVLEAELMPGDGALLAPDWVPWVDRLEEYKLAQAALAPDEGDAEADDLDAAGDELDDDDHDDDDDFGDDPDDGIDFELAAAAGVDEQDEAEAESDDDGPEQPDES